MFRRNGGMTSRMSGAARSVGSVVAVYGDPLAKDEKLRRRLVDVLTTGAAARERARRQTGMTGLARRLATDPVLRAQLTELAEQLRLVQRRVEKTNGHKLRNTTLFAVGVAMVAVAAVPAARKAIASLVGAGETETVVTSVYAEPHGPAQ